MSQEHELDERLRQRVASLYEREASPAIDATARARALGEAWRVQRRARRRRAQVLALGCGVLALAAGVLIMLRGSGRLAEEASQPLAAACRLPAAPVWRVDAGGQRVLALGELGRLVGDGKVVVSSACELRVEVADGTLAGQLHSLKPSRIVIATAGGSVIVTGTRLSVHASGDELRVVLAAGTVKVEEPGGTERELTAGHVLSRRARGGVSTLPLSAAEASRLDQLLGVARGDERAVLQPSAAEGSREARGESDELGAAEALAVTDASAGAVREVASRDDGDGREGRGASGVAVREGASSRDDGDGREGRGSGGVAVRGASSRGDGDGREDRGSSGVAVRGASSRGDGDGREDRGSSGFTVRGASSDGDVSASRRQRGGDSVRSAGSELGADGAARDGDDAAGARDESARSRSASVGRGTRRTAARADAPSPHRVADGGGATRSSGSAADGGEGTAAKGRAVRLAARGAAVSAADGGSAQPARRDAGRAAQASSPATGGDDVSRVSASDRGVNGGRRATRSLDGEDSFTCDERRDGAADSGELLAEGERARKQGRPSLARRCYAAAADGGNADAEVALLRWARFELDHEALDRAGALLARHAREYARPTLAAEAAWLEVQVLAARGDNERARAVAEALIRAHATTPQARAARAWLRQP